MAEKIDFVVLWVDPSDKKWQASRKKYEQEIMGADYIDNRTARYRDWDNFQYWFRGVEKFAPWVNKVHLVTCGHVPKWLNLSHPKLHVVRHEDFMPKGALPTFNSNAIELCMHKIPGLSEQFVAFNDDVFIIKPVKPTDFFKNGKPVNTMSLLAITPSRKRAYCRTLVNNIEIINDHFDFREIKKRDLTKFISPVHGKYLFTTVPLLAYGDCPGFKNYHIGNSYLKSTFEKVWKEEPEILTRTVFSRFRNYDQDVNHWLFNYWQFAEGNYEQHSASFGIGIRMDNPKTAKLIQKQRKHIVCLFEPKEDADLNTDANTEAEMDAVTGESTRTDMGASVEAGMDAEMEKIKKRINASLDRILSEKSEFEK